MVIISYLIRKNMSESPIFAKVKSEGKTSTNPLKESFGKKENFKYVLLALFGVVMGQGVVWYTGQFYAMSFIEKVMNIDKSIVDSLMFYALILGTPFFIVFGWLSDKLGRKWIMMAGMLIAILSYRTIYEKMYQTTNVKNKTEVQDKRVVTGVLKENKAKGIDSIATTNKVFSDGTTLTEIKTFAMDNGAVKVVDGKPKVETKTTIKINDSDKWALIWWVFLQVIFVTMVYGPVAAFLVELFPTKIRYTSMSLPYHIGNGVFGGLLPAVATYLATSAKKANDVATAAGAALPYDKPYLEGLWYPIGVTAVCFIIGVFFVVNSNNSRVTDEA
jgi:MFS family permease